MTGMEDFQKKCREALIDWYKDYGMERIPELEETYVVWSVKVLQNYKALVSTGLPDTIYAECTYNGEQEELYLDVYTKLTNEVIY